MAQELKYSLALDSKQFDGGLASAKSSASGLTSFLGGFAGAAGGLLTSGIAAKVLGGAMDLAKTAASGLFDMVKSGVTSAGQMETLSVSYEVLTGSAATASKAMADVAKMGAETPFQLPDLAEGGKLLLNAGVKADELTASLRVMGNIASAGGMQVTEVAAIYQKMAATGKVTTEHLNQMGERGIPVMEALAQTMGKPKEAIAQMVTEGKIGFPNMIGALNKMGGTGGKFGDQMTRQSKTYEGLMSTLKDNWEGFARTIGQPVMDGLKPVMTLAIDKIGAMTELTAAGVQIVKSAISDGSIGDLLTMGLKLAFSEAVNYGAGGLSGMITLAGQGLSTVFKSAMASFSDGSVAQVFEGVNDLMLAGGLFFAGKLMTSMTSIANTFVALILSGVDKAREIAERLWARLRYKDPDKVNKAINYDTYKSVLDTTGVIDTLGKAFEAQGKSTAKSALGKITDGAGRIMDNTTAAARESFTGADFGKIDLIDTSGLSKDFKAALAKANPEEAAKAMEAWNKLVTSKGGGAEEPAPEAESRLSGGSNKLRDGADEKAKKAAEKLAKAMDDAAIAAAKANGQFGQAAKIELQRKYNEKVKEYKEGGKSEEEARQRAAIDMANNARAEIRLERPGAQAALERANKRERLKSRNAGYFDADGGGGGGGFKGTPLIQQGKWVHPGNSAIPLSPAAAKSEKENLKSTLTGILDEIKGLRAGLGNLQLV